jgi:hypothetical protein
MPTCAHTASAPTGPQTGELDLAWQFPEWNPEKHFVITVLTYLKKAFYFKDLQHPDPPNAEAATL